MSVYLSIYQSIYPSSIHLQSKISLKNAENKGNVYKRDKQIKLNDVRS